MTTTIPEPVHTCAGAITHAVDAVLAASAVGDADQLRVGTYAEFLYGRGDAAGLDLGRPVAYTRDGSVYRHTFERGVTVANVGTVPVEADLGAGYLDLDLVRRRHVFLLPHTADVLFSCADC